MSLLVTKFSAQWCHPCRMMAITFHKVETTMPDVIFQDIDIDKDPTTAADFKIMSIPTIVFIKDGVEVDRVVGLIKEADLTAKINALK